MKKKRNYFITGGLGLIGSTIANKVNGNVIVLSRSKKHRERITRRDIKIVIKSIHTIKESDLKGIDVIYHCASTVDNYNILTDPHLDVRTNIDGTIHLLETIKNFKKKPVLVYLSTFFVYGDEYDKTKKPLDENSRTNPLSLYPATKLCTENVIKIYSRLYSIPYIIFRLTNVYGEYEGFNNPKKGALNYLIMQALLGNDLHIYGGGSFIRDYIYVDDVVSAFKKAEKHVNQTFVIGKGNSVKFADLIKIIHEETKSTSKIISVDIPSFHKAVGITNMAVDTKKIRSLGWKPKISHREAIKKIVRRYRTFIKK